VAVPIWNVSRGCSVYYWGWQNYTAAHGRFALPGVACEWQHNAALPGSINLPPTRKAPLKANEYGSQNLRQAQFLQAHSGKQDSNSLCGFADRSFSALDGSLNFGLVVPLLPKARPVQ